MRLIQNLYVYEYAYNKELQFNSSLKDFTKENGKIY